MAAPRVADYVQELFKDSPVKVGFIRLTAFCLHGYLAIIPQDRMTYDSLAIDGP